MKISRRKVCIAYYHYLPRIIKMTVITIIIIIIKQFFEKIGNASRIRGYIKSSINTVFQTGSSILCRGNDDTYFEDWKLHAAVLILYNI